jgi:hypothetical protein
MFLAWAGSDQRQPTIPPITISCDFAGRAGLAVREHGADKSPGTYSGLKWFLCWCSPACFRAAPPPHPATASSEDSGNSEVISFHWSIWIRTA